MYIIIAGGGIIGGNLAQKLVQLKHDVVVIDLDTQACEAVYAKYGAVTINGNATELEVLESAGIARCDVAVAVMRRDSNNLEFALLAKHYAVSQIIVRMNNPKYEDVYKSVGVHDIARTTGLLIDQIMVNIPEDAGCHGRTVEKVVGQRNFPKNIICSCVYKESRGSLFVGCQFVALCMFLQATHLLS